MTDVKHQRISIKRPDDSVDGRVISYLQSDPFNQGESFPELVLSTLKAHWLPLALFDEGLRGEKMRQIGIRAISNLEAQISVIRRICGIDADPVRAMPVVINQTFGTSGDTASVWREISNNHSNNDSQSNAQAQEVETDDEDEDDDDDWELMDIPQTEEERDANRILGYGQ
ncbi:hypothetical protein [Nostoc sp. CCY0012]|uniref:hypothetical protein n=1 Tax=Nostoc sp. CCY0012 TaxID=1056123 RepID=UPI0039C7280A